MRYCIAMHCVASRGNEVCGCQQQGGGERADENDQTKPNQTKRATMNKYPSCFRTRIDWTWAFEECTNGMEEKRKRTLTIWNLLDVARSRDA
jgi:hypothetical protein